MPEPKVGNPAPDFALIGADAATVQLSFLRHRPVVLCFLSGSDESQAMAAALARRPEVAGRARLVAVFTDPELTSLTATEHFRTATGFTGPVLLDQILGATLEYHAAECPRVWVISSAGVIVYTNRDPAAAPKAVADEVVAALAGMPGTSK
jgi:peroxiredoxin